MKVLIADDEATSRLLLEELLQEWGYETCSAADGHEAWQILEGDQAPSLAILDWMMPGMSGPELCRALRESVNSQYTYTILLTSKSEKKDVILGMDSGADAFLTKPLDIDELSSRLTAAKRILKHQARLSTQLPAVRTTIKAAAEMPVVAGLDPETTAALLKLTTDLKCDAALALAPRAQLGGKVIPTLGKNLILSKIGEGGMGAVYRGYNPRLQCQVAVKVLSTALFREHPAAATRFYREAQIAALVRSEHLISVTDIDQENGLMYLIMELVNGKTATDCLEQSVIDGETGVDESVALDICIAATRGLAAAHAGGIVHRDIKPDNILIPFNESSKELDYTAAKLADLGIARDERDVRDLTQTNAALGTAGYMAPEQICDAKTAGKPADIFGMGATLYMLLCGRTPFEGNSIYEIYTGTISRPHQAVQVWREDVTPTTAAIIDACLAKRAEERYPDANALLEDLIYCRRLLDTRLPAASKSSFVDLPRVIEEAAAPVAPALNSWGIPVKLG